MRGAGTPAAVVMEAAVRWEEAVAMAALRGAAE